MPIAPTNRMRLLARRWLTDTVAVSTVEFAAQTRPVGKAATVETDRRLASALVRQAVGDLNDTTTARRTLREFVVWVDDDDVAAGDRCEFVDCNDQTLHGRFGEVIAVERDSIRAVRRMTVRIPNDD